MTMTDMVAAKGITTDIIWARIDGEDTIDTKMIEGAVEIIMMNTLMTPTTIEEVSHRYVKV